MRTSPLTTRDRDRWRRASGVAHSDPFAQTVTAACRPVARTFRMGGYERFTPVSGSPRSEADGSWCCHVDLFGYEGLYWTESYMGIVSHLYVEQRSIEWHENEKTSHHLTAT
jgi:hypothetical protein